MNLSNYRIGAAVIGLALLTGIPVFATPQTSFQKQYKVIEAQPVAATRIFIKNKKQETVSVQRNYTEALSNTNQFMPAWLCKKDDDAISLMSSKLKSIFVENDSKCLKFDNF
ncbi:MAG TPA: hypothetical protein V6D12_10255 [Candidatus Obscuribacterales bacterium]